MPDGRSRADLVMFAFACSTNGAPAERSGRARKVPVERTDLEAPRAAAAVAAVVLAAVAGARPGRPGSGRERRESVAACEKRAGRPFASAPLAARGRKREPRPSSSGDERRDAERDASRRHTRP